MKKIFTAIILMVICFNARAQFPADLAAMRALNTTQYGCTSFHCITKEIEGFQHDTLYGLINRLYSAAGASGDLEAVTAIGNTTTYGITSTIGANIRVQDDPTTPTGFTAMSPFFFYMRAFPGTGNSYIRAISHSSPHYDAYLPAEGTSADPTSATIVLHKTKDPIIVDNSTGPTSTMSAGLMTPNDGTFRSNVAGSGINCIQNAGGVIQFSLGTSSGIPYLMMKDAGTEYVRLKPIPAISSTRDIYFPDEGTSADVPNSTLVIHKTKDPISVSSGGFLNQMSNSTTFITDGIGNSALLQAGGLLLSDGFHSVGAGINSIFYQDIASSFTHTQLFTTPTANRFAIWQNAGGSVALLDTVVFGTDAAYSVTNINYSVYVELPLITANRVVTLPTGVFPGQTVKVVNLNTSGTFSWSFSGTVQDCSGTAITTLVNNTCYHLEYNGTLWRKIN